MDGFFHRQPEMPSEDQPGVQHPLFYTRTPPFPTVFSDLLKQLQYFTVPSCLLSQPRCILTKFSAFNFQAYVRERSEMCVLLTYSNAVQGGLAQTAF